MNTFRLLFEEVTALAYKDISQLHKFMEIPVRHDHMFSVHIPIIGSLKIPRHETVSSMYMI